MYWRRLETKDWDHKCMFTINQERSKVFFLIDLSWDLYESPLIITHTHTHTHTLPVGSMTDTAPRTSSHWRCLGRNVPGHWNTSLWRPNRTTLSIDAVWWADGFDLTFCFPRFKTLLNLLVIWSFWMSEKGKKETKADKERINLWEEAQLSSNLKKNKESVQHRGSTILYYRANTHAMTPLKHSPRTHTQAYSCVFWLGWVWPL